MLSAIDPIPMEEIIVMNIKLRALLKVKLTKRREIDPKSRTSSQMKPRYHFGVAVAIDPRGINLNMSE